MDELSRKRLQEIVLKDIVDLSEDDKAFLRARSSYLVPSEKEKFASILNPVEPKEEKVKKSRKKKS